MNAILGNLIGVRLEGYSPGTLDTSAVGSGLGHVGMFSGPCAYSVQ